MRSTEEYNKENRNTTKTMHLLDVESKRHMERIGKQRTKVEQREQKEDEGDHIL